jgi:hypothetical protein
MSVFSMSSNQVTNKPEGLSYLFYYDLIGVEPLNLAAGVKWISVTCSLNFSHISSYNLLHQEKHFNCPKLLPKTLHIILFPRNPHSPENFNNSPSKNPKYHPNRTTFVPQQISIRAKRSQNTWYQRNSAHRDTKNG